MLANVTHFETPLDPLGSAQMVFEGRRQADHVIRFLRAEFPDIFAQRADSHLRQPGPAPDALDRRAPAADARRDSSRARGLPTPRRDAHGGWSCTTRQTLVHWEKFAPGPRLLHPASVHGAEGRRQHRRRRPLRGCRRAARCRPFASWARASRWAPRPRTRSTWPEPAPCTRSTTPRCSGDSPTTSTRVRAAVREQATQPRFVSFVIFEFFVVDLARSLRCLCALLENRNQRGVSVLARELQRRQAVLVARVGLRA